ncbi:MAG: ABC transporter ATP-binding protein, partial [Clostridiaceae bacterium]|nr:ABC transporter ATP-binding protein [Clostridiaceae bacterium]
LGMGLVPSLDMVDNVMLKSYKQKKSFLVDRKTPQKVAERLVQELEIVTPDVFTPIRKLSGGNVQKILVGREIDSSPRLLIVAYPVRGLDINSSYTIYRLLNEQKEKGVAVIFIGEDLDVLMEISDRLLVLSGGRVTGVVDPRRSSKQAIGLMMLGHQHHEEEGAAAV